MSSESIISETLFPLYQNFLAEDVGLYFDESSIRSLSISVLKRMEVTQIDSFSEYLSFIKYNSAGAEELKNLVDIITIPETYFFRNTPQFDALIKTILPEFIAKRVSEGNYYLNIWSAGCSTGAEPYSIAIAVNEALGSVHNWKISILATDINRTSMKFAQKGVYTSRYLEHLSDELKDRYFTKKGSQYHLDASIIDMVDFQYHNLVTDLYCLKGMKELDMVFCRNVTIYFSHDVTRKVIANIYQTLTDGGYLFIGHSETLYGISQDYETVEFPDTFIYRKNLGANSAEKQITFPIFEKTPILQVLPSPPIPDLSQIELPHHLHAITLQSPPPPKKMHIKTQEKHKTENQLQVSELLFIANEYADNGRLDEALAVIADIFKIDSFNVGAHLLSGILCYGTQEYVKAENHLKTVKYYDHENVVSYYYLGEIYSDTKQNLKAQKEYKNAINLLKKLPKEKHIGVLGNFTAGFLLTVCEKKLKNL